MRILKGILGTLSAALLLAAAAHPAGAQSAYPTRPIKLTVPFPPGGNVDIVARVISQRLSENLGQPIVIENRAGAGGMIGSGEVAKSEPDGHTLLMVFDTHAVNHHLLRSISFDTFKAFKPITLMASSPMVLVTSNKLGAASVGALVAQAKAKDDAISFGHVGPGSSNQLVSLQFQQAAGIKLNGIAYRGGGPLVTDILGGHVDTAFASLPLVVNQVQGKQMTGLAIASKKRVAQLPDVPTVAEAYPGFEASSWVGMLVPAGVPQLIADRLHAEVTAILREPAITARLQEQGYVVEATTSDAFAAFIRQESDRWGPVIKANNLAGSN